MATTITLAALDSQGAAQIAGGITHPGMTSHFNGSHQGVWIDPYNPVEFYYSSGAGIFSYHITNDVTTTHIANAGFSPDRIVRSFTDSKLYAFADNSLTIYEVTDPTTPVLLSLTPTILMRTLAISADGTTFYYTGNDTRLFALDIATGVSTVLYTHGSVMGNLTYVLAADPKDGNTLYFTDANNDLYSYDIALDTATVILATNAGNAFCLQALDGVCYIGTWVKSGFGITRVLADGTGFDAYTPSLSNKINMLDTINKQIIQFDFGSKTRIFDAPSIGDWPPPPEVNWVLNGSSQYEISSKDHLLNLMTQGTYLANNTGSVPPNYWTASYIQTVDIDLENDSNITPIGGATRFTGIYDGDSYSISNWTYNTAGQYIGLFGATNTGCTLRNIKLAGVWNLDVDFTGHGGFLCGFLENSFAYNCEGDFDVGTYQGVTTSNWVQGGTMIGQAKLSTLQGFTVKGSVDIDPLSTANKGHGGVFGTTEKCYVKFVRNLANFPSGIKNQYRTAGICAFAEQDYEWSNVINAMTGDIWAATSAGIFGYIRLGTGANTTIDNIVLSMTGDIFNQSGGVNGGGFAFTLTTAFEPIILTGFVNYMTGDTYAATIRTASGANDLTIQDSIIAPNGTFLTVDTGTNSTTGTFTETTKYDDSFGLTFTTNNGGSSTGATLSAAFLTHSQFNDLPYLDISGTDGDGNSYDWDFIYANVGGNATEYPDYTHAILHKDDVSSPFVVDYDTVASGFNGTTLQVTFANFGTDTVYVQLAFTVTSTTAGTTTTFSFPAPLTVTPGAITIDVLLHDAGANAYRLGVTPSGGSEFISIDSTTSLTPLISNVLPETGYTVSLYSDTGSGFVFVASEATTTLANSAANYAAGGADFADGSGGFDLTDLNDDSLALFSSVMDSLFTTGDDLAITLSGITRETTYAKVGGTLVVDKADTEPIVSIGFSGAALQTSTIDLTDDADVTTSYGVDYDPITTPATPSYTINGMTYFAGDSFILNGKKVTLAEF